MIKEIFKDFIKYFSFSIGAVVFVFGGVWIFSTLSDINGIFGVAFFIFYMCLFGAIANNL